MAVSQLNQLQINGRIYIGHPLAEKRYLTNIQLKVASGSWNLSITKIKDVIVGVKLIHSSVEEKDLVFDQERKIKLTDAVMLADYDFFSGLSENGLLAIQESCHKLRTNENYLPFEIYTERIHNTPLKPLDELKGLTPKEAIVYVKMRDTYDADTKYSNKEALYWDYLVKTNLFLACYEEPQNFLVKLGNQNSEVKAIYIDLM